MIKARELDLIRVKGKSESTRIFELQHPSTSPDSSGEDWFGKGLTAYRAQDWSLAEQAFSIQSKENEDPVAEVYLQRISALGERSLPQDWDGVWVFETK